MVNAGIRWIQQVFDLDQARRAVDLGVDVIVAQGGEAGGNGGQVSTMVMVPAVVDMAGTIPVVAAGGIADGRGLAAALALGAQGVNLGTRFLASTEATVAGAWKQSVVDAGPLDAVKLAFADAVMPPLSPGGVPATPRALRTPFVDRWNADPDGAVAAADQLRDEIVTAIGGGRLHEYLLFAGQSAALVRDVVPARVIVERIVADARTALEQARQWAG